MSVEIQNTYTVAMLNIRTLTNELRNQRTPKSELYERDGPFDKKTGKPTILTYVKKDYTMTWLDNNYPGWSWEIIPESFREFASYVQLAGRLTVVSEGLPRKIVAYGQDKIDFKRDSDIPLELMYAKSCETDALKRAANYLGFAHDVYSGDIQEPEEISEDACKWYWEEIYPLVRDRVIDKKMTYKNLTKQIIKYFNNEITRDQLIKNFKEKS